MLRAISLRRLLIGDCVSNKNSFNTIKLRKQFKHDKPATFLEPDDSFELGNFENDLKPYLKNKKDKKRASWYPEEEDKTKEGIPIIICKDKKLNHYRNQTYNKFKPIPLASEHWRSHKFVGDYFKIKIHTKDYELQDRKEVISVDQSDLRPEIIEILKSHGIESLSEIQKLAIPAILSGKNNLFGAETGCGKTLAYILPILEQILAWKAKAPQPSFNAPYVLILVPSRELSDQVKEFCKWFQGLGIKTRRLVGGNVIKKINNPSFDEIDILVSTPFVAQKLIDADIYSLKNVRHVVLDEADCLLDDSFNEMLISFLSSRLSFRSVPSPEKDVGVQLTMVSATLPTSVSDILQDLIDVEQLETITTDKLHFVMPHVTHKFIRTGRTSRPSFFLDIVKKDFKKKASIVFCNHSETATWVNTFLEDNGISNILLHGDMRLRDRNGRFRDFQNGVVNTMVCTSLAARGLDTHRVEHVINYEFPSFMADYVHRCGRTGRLSSKKPGVVTNLISGRNEVHLVQKIEMAVRTMSKFENVNPNIKRIVKYNKATELEKKLGLLD